jgi:GntR family transcriptional regulator
MELVEKSGLPLFQQIVEDMRGNIEAGRYVPGGIIPSERELSEHYSVSRVTVRRAIKELVDMGILSKKQGKGTFVSAAPLERKITQTPEVLTFAQMCEAAGKQPGTRVMRVDEIMGDQRDLEFLGLPKGSNLLRIQRVRTADEMPVMLENSLTPIEGFEFLRQGVMREPGIFGLIEENLGRKAGGHVHCSLRIAKADVEMSKQLEVPMGEPLFMELIDLVDSDGKPLLIAKNYVVGSLMVFDF